MLTGARVWASRLSQPSITRYTRFLLPLCASLSTTTATITTGSSLNEKILAALHEARAAEQSRPDRNRYRIRSFNKAIQQVGYLEKDLVSDEDIERLEGVSEALKKGLGTLVRRLRMEKMRNPLLELDEENEKHKKKIGSDDAGVKPRPEMSTKRAEDEARTKIVNELQSVPGIGITTAKHLVSLGVQSVEHLRSLVLSSFRHSSSSFSPSSLSSSTHSSSLSTSPRAHSLSSHPILSNLTKNQLTSLKYLPHLIQPVTRAEVDRVYTLIKSVLPSHFEVVRVGAYRRGFPISQRIDICLFHPLFHPEVRDVPVPTTKTKTKMKKASEPNVVPLESTLDSSDLGLEEYDSIDKPDRRGRIDLAFRSPSISSSVKESSLFLNQVVPALRSGGLVALGDFAELSVGQWKWSGIVRVPEVKAGNEEGAEHNKGEEGKNGILTNSDLSSADSADSTDSTDFIQIEPLNSRLRALRSSSSSPSTGTYRKLDISIAPLPSRATALLFLTGDMEFVRDMKVRASRMGMILNEFGLWVWESESKDEKDESEQEHPPSTSSTAPVPQKRGRPRHSPSSSSSNAPQNVQRQGQNDKRGHWTLLPTPTESSLFASLGLDFIPPSKRNYSFLLSRYHKSGGKLRRGGEEGAGVGVVLRS